MQQLETSSANGYAIYCDNLPITKLSGSLELAIKLAIKLSKRYPAHYWTVRILPDGHSDAPAKREGSTAQARAGDRAGLLGQMDESGTRVVAGVYTGKFGIH